MPRLTSGYRFPARGKYPWRDWEDGSIWQINPADYDITAIQLRDALAQRASRQHLRIESAVEPDGTVVFRFRPKGDQ